MITNQDKLTCVKRELQLRRRVYDRLVANGTMTPTTKEREIALMAAIVADYEALSQARLPLDESEAPRLGGI